MAVNPAAAAGAYAAALKALNPAPQTAPAANAGDFADSLKAALQGAAATGHEFEAGTAALGTPRSDVVDLVTAVAETEVAVETLVTVRDRVIAAYQDILNMPI